MALYYSILAILVLLSFAYNAFATSGIGIITTIAGTGTQGFGGDGDVATNANLSNPYGVHVDSAGNIYIADTTNNRIRKVDANGMISTIAGSGACGQNGDNILATTANLCGPQSLTSDSLGNLYMIDRNHNLIRKIDTNGMIVVVAGDGNFGFNGDNIAATAANLGYPLSISLDKEGILYMADSNNNRIRKVDASGIITTVAGSGSVYSDGDSGLATAASIGYPTGVSLDSSGNIYIASSNRIRKVDVYGIINTVAGTGTWGFSGDGGMAINANILPTEVFPDAFGNLYIADTYNNRIRKIDVNGIITTVAGTGQSTADIGINGYNGDNKAATDATLSYPYSLCFDSTGNMYIADSSNYRIRKVTFPAPPTVMPTFMTTSRSTTAKPTKATSTKTPSFRPTNKPTKKKTAAPSRRPTKKPTKKPSK